MALSLVPPSPSKKAEFLEHDDDDGFLYVLDCSSWIWKAGTCATETVDEKKPQPPSTSFAARGYLESRSYYPPARARHTATPVTEDGNFTIVFGGYKTKTSGNREDETYGDNTYGSSIGQPLNDAWQLQTVGQGDGVRFIWKR